MSAETDGELAVLDVAARIPRSGGGFSADVVVAQLRSIVTDLLCATGMDRDEARAAASATRRDRGPELRRAGERERPVGDLGRRDVDDQRLGHGPEVTLCDRRGLEA